MAGTSSIENYPALGFSVQTDRRTVPKRKNMWIGKGQALRGIPLLRVILIAFLAFSNAAAAAETPKKLIGRAKVIDGDTIHVKLKHLVWKIRLTGIDAPEKKQKCHRGGKAYWCGVESTNFLTKLVHGKLVLCDSEGTDRYRRVLARCTAGTVNINMEMVRVGHAVAYRKYSKLYVPEEDKARFEKRGLWAGTFDMPWDWRKRQ